jgi:DNA-binding SARP family transcriptional activator
VPQFGVLGPLEATSDGGAVIPLAGQKQRALLALLLLNANEVVSSDRLIDQLWNEDAPATAATSLRNLITGLRKAIGHDAVSTRPPGYVLTVNPSDLDLMRFERVVARARRLAPDARARALREGLAMWRGPPLADLLFEPFAQPEVHRLEELRLAVLEDLAEAELEAGGAADLVPELEGLVAQHPLRERLRVPLMLALYRGGRQAEALDVYHEARQALAAELGIDPGPQLQELYRKILRQEAGLSLSPPPPAADHFVDVVEVLASGRLVPVIGTDVGHLAAQLAERFDYRANGDPLTRISQHVALTKGSGPLYDELHSLLAVEVEPTPVHRFLASLPPRLRAHGVPHQLIVTTSYDLALERAFLDADEEFDVVSYVAAGRHRGRFCHLAPDGSAGFIETPNTYSRELSLDRRTIILKLHGRVDASPEREWESFVVTEDDYIEYLARADVSSALPVRLAAKLRRSHFLFLGYTMSDWNLRVVLNRLWGEQPLTYRSWAIQGEPKLIEREFWRRRDVDVLELPLGQYVSALEPHAELALAGAPS